MDYKEFLEDTIEKDYSELQKQIDSYYKLNGKIEKIRGRLNGRIELAKFIQGIDIIIDTSGDFENTDKLLREYINDLSFEKESIINLVEKIKLGEKLLSECVGK